MSATPASAGNGSAGHGFGTAPVFPAGISTILGAVLFLRFGYSVAHAGALGTLLILVPGHAVIAADGAGRRRERHQPARGGRRRSAAGPPACKPLARSHV